MPAAARDAQQRGQWWEVFTDPNLNELEIQLNTANPDLQAWVARFVQARAIAPRMCPTSFPRLISTHPARERAAPPRGRCPGSTAISRHRDNFMPGSI